jgi:hypothetical protein
VKFILYLYRRKLPTVRATFEFQEPALLFVEIYFKCINNVYCSLFTINENCLDQNHDFQNFLNEHQIMANIEQETCMLQLIKNCYKPSRNQIVFPCPLNVTSANHPRLGSSVPSVRENVFLKLRSLLEIKYLIAFPSGLSTTFIRAQEQNINYSLNNNEGHACNISRRLRHGLHWCCFITPATELTEANNKVGHVTKEFL